MTDKTLELLYGKTFKRVELIEHNEPNCRGRSFVGNYETENGAIIEFSIQCLNGRYYVRLPQNT